MLNGYTDTIVFLFMAKKIPKEMGESGSRYAGVANQAGAFVGSLLSFLVVQLGAI